MTRALESFSCKRPNPFFCDTALADELTQASAIGDDARREAALERLASRYQQAAPSLFLVEQVDLYAYRPGLRSVQLVNRVPAYEAIQSGRDR